jgi:hypothetical protein
MYGNPMKRGGFILVAGMALAAFAARAQTPDSHYDVKDINFDMWCQEQQHWAPERCDQRLPADEQAFEAYRSKIEEYEVPFLKERDKRQDLDRNILHNDPVDHPTEPSIPPQQPVTPMPPK